MRKCGHNLIHTVFTSAMDREFFKEAVNAVSAEQRQLKSSTGSELRLIISGPWCVFRAASSKTVTLIASVKIALL
jgi:hypothetical protein